MSRPELSPEQHRQLAAEWTPDTDGILSRNAARVVIFDEAGHTYLIRGHDFGDTEHWWWFTVGGGLERHENARQGALRELREETGLVVGADRLIGPVMQRRAEFHFALETRRQHEVFFVLHLDAAEVSSLGEHTELTALESELLDEWKWWDTQEMRKAIAKGAVFYPLGFPELAERWREGWDGAVLVRDEYETPSDNAG